MKNSDQKLSMHDRVQAVLQGKQPDRLPFIDRMEIWYQSKCWSGSLPAKYHEMSLNDIHQSVGIGRQKFTAPYAFKLRNIEVVCTFENEIIFRDFEPVTEYFPAQWAPDQIPRDKAGTTTIEYVAPVGKLSIAYEVAESMVAMGGVEPYLTHHLIKAEEDYRTAEYIIEHTEIVPQFDKIREDQCELGDNGFVVPCLHRIPFQQALLEYLGEVPLFTALYDSPQQLNRLLHLLDLQLMEIFRQMADLPSIYVEFGDNLDGTMTNPKLFKEYSLPYYQKYADILHGQGKKVGSHTDGNVKPLLSLLAQSGLDVCESFSPAPLTECTFEEAWETWQHGPLIWGGVPSPILEKRTSESEFRDYIHRLLEIIGNRNIILGVGDMVLGNNLIERVEYIAKEVEHHRLV
ncbi:MAG: uroporphyrinogen decarboxylase family protein [Desulfobacterales bacterium]